MNNEFLDLYYKWRNTFIFSAFGSADPRAKDAYEKLKEWSLENVKEAVECIKEILLEEPNDVVLLLPDILGTNIEIDGWMPLDSICNIWLNILNHDISDDHEKKELKDYYKDYREFKEYMKDNYIPWNPVHEEDPNITFEEFKQGKRNKKKEEP